MLTSGQISSLETYLHQLGSRTLQRGRAYAAQGRVHTLKKDLTKTRFHATVEGTENYETVLGLDKNGWDSDCSCPVGSACKHGAAVAYLLLDSNNRATSPSVRSPGSAKASTGEGIFKKHLPAKADWNLRRAVQELERAWNDYQDGSRSIHGRTLEKIFGSWTSRTEIYQPFPEKDLEAPAFWHFLIALAREHQVSSLPDLGALNDLTPSLPLIKGYRRAREVDFWNKALGRARSSAQVTPEISLKLRLKVDLEKAAFLPQVFHWKKKQFTDLSPDLRQNIVRGMNHPSASSPLGNLLLRYIQMEGQAHLYPRIRGQLNPAMAQLLLQIFQLNRGGDEVVNSEGQPLPFCAEPLAWTWTGPTEEGNHFGLSLQLPSRAPAYLEGKIIHLATLPPCCVTAESIHPSPASFLFANPIQLPLSIPGESILSEDGIQSLLELGCPVPPELAKKATCIRPVLHVLMEMDEDYGPSRCRLQFKAIHQDREVARLEPEGWQTQLPSDFGPGLCYFDLKYLHESLAWIRQFPNWSSISSQIFSTSVGKSFPMDFVEWVSGKPDHCTLDCDQELGSLLRDPVKGSWKIDLTPSGVDWFDLSSSLTVNDTELTAEEIKLLLAAQGGMVRIKGKGWKRLEVEEEGPAFAELRELGIDPSLETSAPQRLHTLQLAGTRIADGSGKEVGTRIRERAAELKSFVPPKLPAVIQAKLRPYQLEGFQFLARLSHCSLGGILADDMGLGKTVQALAWLAWLRASRKEPGPALVVCPKSVTDNWVSEAARFFPDLKVFKATAQNTEGLMKEMRRCGLIVANYAQLRLLAGLFQKQYWLAAILDEGQYIKNPAAKTAAAARSLQADFKLVLTGTPIENRLLDLWSQMQFAMPGALPAQTSFQRQFNEKNNPLARQNLSRRIRPFLLRRTKIQVAADLPARIEEDIYCELEGTQLSLYQAHLKEARQILLQIKSKQDLDKSRFNILTSLLRLRQACCHPRLIHKKSKGAEPSAKLDALLDLVEPLMAEGQKVLVFSQFVEMLTILRDTLKKNGSPCYYLDGKTEDRSQVVNSFQNHEGAALFLISLKAGGSGLNLTAASYVILFDPWWNPAVEAQAIDRTHRIGQKQTVIAYRLIAKNTIEEKIRELQKQKTKLFQDVLGEENFGQALSLDDFRFLLADSNP